MTFDDIHSGAVIRYPYLWTHQATDGETEGRKQRPVVVGVRLPRPNGEDVVLHFPITSQKPTSARFAAKIPATEKRRAGLSNTLHLWLILDEYNQDVVGKSFYLEAAILIMA